MPIGVMVTLRREQMYEFLRNLFVLLCLVSVTSRVLKAS
jgi:ribosomal protein L5